MSFVTAALIGGGVALATGVLGAGAAKSAAGTQAGAANRATDAQLQMFDTVNRQQAPYRQAGQTALSSLLTGLGLPSQKYDANGNVAAAPGAPTREQFTKSIGGTPGQWVATPGGPSEHMTGGTGAGGGYWAGGSPGSTSFDQTGYDNAMGNWNASQGPGGMPQTGASPIADGYFNHQFNAGDLNANLAPNYQFMLDQGLGATKNAANLQTGLVSGNTLKGINDYAQNYAQNGYQQAYNNYTANQTNIFNRLSNIAGLGQTANQATGNAAVQTGQNVGNSMQAAGAAQAAGTVGQANALTGAANNALGWYSLSQIMNKGGNV